MAPALYMSIQMILVKMKIIRLFRRYAMSLHFCYRTPPVFTQYGAPGCFPC
jgi:hypothetical protein